MPDGDPFVKFLNEAFRLDEETGIIYWRRRPGAHFTDTRTQRQFNTRLAGRPALATPSANGYLHGKIRFGGELQHVTAHRVAFALSRGFWPTEEIDHADGVKSNNRPSNLREASRGHNAHNFSRPNKTGLRGVNRDKWGGFNAKIRIDGRKVHLGRFTTPEAAHQAYTAAAERVYGQFARAR